MPRPRSGLPAPLPSPVAAAIPAAILTTLLAATLLVGCASLPARPGTGDTAPPLATGIGGAPAGGEVDRYRLDLDQETRFVRIVVYQEGLDVALELLDPDGRTVATSDGPGGSGAEVLAAVTGRSGSYRLAVVPRGGEEGGRYRIGPVEVRAATPGEDRRIAGLRAYARAGQLRSRDAGRESVLAALELYREAAAHFAAIGDETLHAWALYRTAEIHARLDDWPRALQLSRRAVDIFSRLADPTGLPAALSYQARAQDHLGRTGEALDSYSRALDLYLRLAATAGEGGDPASRHSALHGAAFNLNNRGALHRSLGDLDRALADLERAAQIWQGLPDRTTWWITAVVNQGAVYRQRGELATALRLYEQASELARDTGVRRNDLHLFINLGRYHLTTGELDRAQDVLHRGLELSRELGDRGMERALIRNLGVLHRLLGDGDSALLHFRQALELSRRLGEPTLRAESLLDVGHTLHGQGEPDLARQSFEAALEAAREAGAPPLEAMALRDLARLESTADPAAALVLARRARGLVRATDRPLTSSILRAEARALSRLGDLPAARATLERALELDLSVDNPWEHGEVLATLGHLEHRSGLLDAARQHLEAALEVYEGLRTRVGSLDMRASLLAGRRDRYLELMDLYVDLDAARPDQGFAARSLGVSERSRARSLVELLTEARVDVRGRIGPGLRQREEAIHRDLSLLQAELMEATAAGNDAAADGGARVRRLRALLDRAWADYRQLESEIRRTSAAYADLRYPRPRNLEQIQALLPPDTVLVQYALHPRRSLVFVVRRDRFDYRTLPAAAEIEQPVRTVLRAISAPHPMAAQRFATASRQSYDLLLAPIEDLLTGTSRLCIVPDGVLFYLPFEALRDAGSGDWVLQRWTVSYVSSATVLATLPSPGRGPFAADFVAFADPLTGSTVAGAAPSRGSVGAPAGAPPPPAPPGLPALPPLPASQEEVRRIARLVPGPSKLYLRGDARQGNVFGNPWVSGARWLHFASHGLVREDEPAASAILLSPDAQGDSMLQVFEIFNLDVAADLVVLSACDTGLGKAVDGEGIVGLSRAFFYAGAPRLVVSLWDIADTATSELMNSFYGAMLAGDPPIEALRTAKLDMLQSATFRSPRYWAPFILVGRPGA